MFPIYMTNLSDLAPTTKPGPSAMASPPQQQIESPTRTPSDGTNAHHQHEFAPPQHANAFNGFEHRVESGFKSLKSLARRGRKSTHTSLQDLSKKDAPYHRYVRDLIAAGWRNLSDLDDYLERPAVPHDEVVSVLDIRAGAKHNYQDLRTNFELRNFLATNKKPADVVRVYMAEYSRLPSAELIEAFGSNLQLDPRFFKWCVHSKGHVIAPSQRHRVPYSGIGCGVLDATTSSATDVEKFKTLVYVREEAGHVGWTALFLFSSRTKIDISIQQLTDPPLFPSTAPAVPHAFKSFRELYLESFNYINPDDAVKSPFYLTSSLFALNCFCWNQVINTIREEDARVGGISDTTIGHAEEITKSLSVIERMGSYHWHGRDEKAALDRQAELIEDYTHLVGQIKLLWENRDKMADIRKRNSDARWTALTNAFTYLFAPVTIISGIYGMSVSQISGSSSNPSIWQFFLAVAVFNILIVIALSISASVQIMRRHGRRAHWKEMLGYSVGRMGPVGCK